MTNNRGRFQGKSPFFDPSAMSTEDIKSWLANHQMCLDVGVNIGSIDRAKASKFRLELARRPRSSPTPTTSRSRRRATRHICSKCGAGLINEELPS